MADATRSIARLLSTPLPVASRSVEGRVFDALLASTPSSIVAGLGFYAVHHLAVRRQRRDEFFKQIQSILDQIRGTTTDAVMVWTPPINGSTQPEAVEATAITLVYRVTSISKQIAALTRLQTKFILGSEIVVYRKAVTQDIEMNLRPLDQDRTNQVRLASEDLEAAIQTGYHTIFG